ncbi:hypothetical protein [Planctomycetes bacterium K23_9]|uniref:hypothetical protein n=1 Tax=Stieleria marina TaxID=1930275 RepID=UPI0011A9CCA9
MDLSTEHTAKTPHMDPLAKLGVLFAIAHCATLVFGPSRACVMTGGKPLPRYNATVLKVPKGCV